MKINEFSNKELKEDRIDYYYREKTKEVHEILGLLKKYDHKLIGKAEHQREVIFPLSDVYYFESVDKKTYAYLRHQVIRITDNLVELSSAYHDHGFIRVNKSMVLNIYKVDCLSTELNMKLTAQLDNGEKIPINRSYKAKFNQYLRTMNQEGAKQ